MGAIEQDTPFWEQPLDTLDSAQWEALCDGCGKCCLNKVEDADTGRIYPTNVACRLLNTETARCSDYKRRRRYVPDCIRLTPAKLDDYVWLPPTCAYVLRHAGKPLPDWHYLISGNRDSIIEAGQSIKGRVISEIHVSELEKHIIAEPL